MKLATFIKQLEELDCHSVQSFFEKDSDGGCPCFSGRKTIDGKKLHVWGRCWRVSENVQDLNIWSDLPTKDRNKIAHIIKKLLDEQEWYNPYTIIYHNEDFS